MMIPSDMNTVIVYQNLHGIEVLNTEIRKRDRNSRAKEWYLEKKVD